MKQEFIDFKKQFNEEIFENNSIEDNELFGIKDLLSEEYLNNKYYVSKDTLNKCREELTKILHKYKFILSSYENLKDKLGKEILELDNEFIKLNEVSTLGNSFFNMTSLDNHYNNVIPYDIIYKKNIVFTNEYSLKTDESLEPIPYKIKEAKDSFFIYFEEPRNIQDIFIELYNEFRFSIFGVKQDDTMDNLFTNVHSDQKLFINVKPEYYKGLFITGIGNIYSHLKDIKVYDYFKRSIRKSGYIFYKLKELEKIKKIFYFSNSQTKLYALNTKQAEELSELMIKDENVEKLLNKNSEINKNKEYILSNKDIVIIEVFERTINMSERLKIYGLEV